MDFKTNLLRNTTIISIVTMMIINKLFLIIVSLSIPKYVRIEDRKIFCELFNNLKQEDSHNTRYC